MVWTMGATIPKLMGRYLSVMVTRCDGQILCKSLVKPNAIRWSSNCNCAFEKRVDISSTANCMIRLPESPLLHRHPKSSQNPKRDRFIY